MNTNIHVNVNEIPPEVAVRIGCVFLGFHKRFQQSPELMAELEAYRASCFFFVAIFVFCQVVDFIRARILAVFCAAACCRRFSPAKQMGLHMDRNRS